VFADGNFPEDIANVNASAIPDFDILCAGFPCQTFSVAGRQKGFNDPRGQMIFHIIRILKAKQPKAFVLENVRGLVSHDDGSTFITILRLLKDAGYYVRYKILKACDYGLPQFRPRVFIVGFRYTMPFEFPKPVPLSISLADIMGGSCSKEIAYTLTVKGLGRYYGDPRCIDMYLVDGVPKRVGVAEARQLMGFPAWFVFPVSRTQAMKQLGNAVAVPVAAAVVSEVLRMLKYSFD